MRLFVPIAVVCSLCASTALAQQLPAQSGPSNAAVKGVHENISSAPVAGANSFTKDQAVSAIEAKGYGHVAKLKLDGKGVWRGTAMKDGKSAPVSVDYQGNVN